MEDCSQEEREDQFFDIVPDDGDSPDLRHPSPPPPSYDVWKQPPRSVAERRGGLLAQMGLLSPPPPSSPARSIQPTCLEANRVRLDEPDLTQASNSQSDRALPSANNNCSSNRHQNGLSCKKTQAKAALSRSLSSNSSAPLPFINRQRGESQTVQSYLSNPVGERDSTFIERGNINSVCRMKNEWRGKELMVDRLGKKLHKIDTSRRGLIYEEFEKSAGLSPIVQEVQRREREEEEEERDRRDLHSTNNGIHGQQKKKEGNGWLKTLIEFGKGSKQHGSVSEQDNEGGLNCKGRRSDDSLDATKRVKVGVHRKPVKEFTELHTRQEFRGHEGSIWTMKFSPDGCHLASAGQDRVVQVWEVIFENSKGSDSSTYSLERVDDVLKRASSGRRKKPISSLCQPTELFLLSEKSKCSCIGHTEEILDLSWSKSQTLLSSSMDKTVRLWDISSGKCLKIFTHNDYVTCIQFNPINDEFFISGSLDGKVRIWSIEDHQVVNWIDLHEMVTAACYTPDGKGAVVGSYKGTCHIYKQAGNKLQLEYQFDVRRKKGKKSHGKKITGFQFVPGDDSKVLITSSDSRIRIYDKTELSCKFKGFRNSKSLICASFSANGRYIVCASEDSRVCIWTRNKSHLLTYSGWWKRKSTSYEDFYSRNVLVALPWPGRDSGANQDDSLTSRGRQIAGGGGASSSSSSQSTVSSDMSPARLSFSCLNADVASPCRAVDLSLLERPDANGHQKGKNTYLGSRESSMMTTTLMKSMAHGVFPEEKLVFQCDDFNTRNQTTNVFSEEDSDCVLTTSAWGLVIVTAGLNGEIRVFQNYGMPVRV